MHRQWLFLATIFFFTTLFLPLIAQNKTAYSSPDPQSLETLHGRIVSIQKYSIATRPVPYIQFILLAEGKEYTVEVGPDWILELGGVLLVPREEIEVIGFLMTKDQHNILIASQIRKGETVIKLRSAEGKPLWGNQRSLQP